MTDFYTNVQLHKGKILYRGIEDGERISERVGFAPTLYLLSDKETRFKTIDGRSVEPIHFDSIYDCKQFVDEYSKIDNFHWFGNTRHEYAFISEQFPQEHVEYDIKKLLIAKIDIETESVYGFPKAANPREAITAITLQLNEQYHVFSCVEYENKFDDVIYYKCRDEADLILRFLNLWTSDYPDVLTGWYIAGFDVPYLHARIEKLFGKEKADSLSPWGIVYEKEVHITIDKSYHTKKIIGIAILDYLDMYKKFVPGGVSKPNHKLDTIAFIELNERKIPITEEGGIRKLHLTNPQKFIEYNIQDVRLIDRMDAKLNVLSLVFTLAYQAKVNFEDAFQQVTMWDAIIFNRLKRDNIVVPPQKDREKKEKYEGAYVKEPITGKHEYIVSFDFDSLYPHLIILSNIGPDTILDPADYPQEIREWMAFNDITVDNLLNKKIDTSILKKYNLALAANGHLFRRDKQSFLSVIMEEMYANRKKFKGMMSDAKKKLNETTAIELIEQLKNEASTYSNLQNALKVSLNSAYGATGNEHFRHYDVRQATGITVTGKLSILWVEKVINEYLNKVCGTKDVKFVLYLDTDSCYITLKPLIDKVMKPDTDIQKIIDFMDKVCKEKLQKVIDDSCDDLAEYLNSYKSALHMKRESLADIGIWTKKKRYIINSYDDEGVRYKTPKLKIMGLEIQKGSTPEVYKPPMKKAIEIMVSGTKEELVACVDEAFRITKQDVSYKEIALVKQCNNIEKYSDSKTLYRSGCPAHVRAAIVYNNYIKSNGFDKDYPLIVESDKIKYLWLKEPNILRSNIIGFIDELPKELNIEKLIDYHTQFDKGYREPVQIIANAVGWNTVHVDTLEDLFE